MKRNSKLISVFSSLAFMALLAQNAVATPPIISIATSPVPSKRGLCYNSFSEGELKLLANSKVTWAYNWAPAANEPEGIGPGKPLEFMPMIWGAGDNMLEEADAYLSTHPGVKVILGINEPMMKTEGYGGCDTSPYDAAIFWPKLEALAEKYNLEIGGPALTWGFEPLSDGKIYSPVGWTDAFIRQYKKLYKKEPRMDYIVLHSYMDYPSAVLGFCEEYAKIYKKKIILTEFCAWSSNPNEKIHKSRDAQISSMTQKVEAMEHDPNIVGYCWFMSHGDPNAMPYYAIFPDKDRSGKLTELGKVYLYMSACDKNIYYTVNAPIPAAEYVASSNYDLDIGGKKWEEGTRFALPIGLETASDEMKTVDGKRMELQIGGLTNRRYAEYQINFPEERAYIFNLRIALDKKQTFVFTCDGKEIGSAMLEPTDKKWQTVPIELNVPAGQHVIRITSKGGAKFSKLYWFEIN